MLRRYLEPNVLALVAVLGVLVNLNKISLHYFYRDRLAETYLRTETPKDPKNPSPLVTRRNSMKMELVDLHGSGPEPYTTAPYHLVSAAINLAGSRDLTRKDRKSGFFLFSKYYCGSKQTGYCRTDEYRNGETKLARAVTISGAAFGSAMGYHTFFAQAFATTLFNVRLGYWMENPGRHTCKGRERLVFWPRWMGREMFSHTDARSRLVNLSDGGHTGDNVGIYPLFQRQCQVVIACDAEADPTLGFGSFTQALRYAYVDLGVNVDIDLDMIRPDPETGKSRSHCAIGRIRYKDDDGTTIPGNNWLVYIKSSMTGDEPAPVQNYKHTNQVFPHESTADQFFNDDQFESYRALGRHMANHTFGHWLDAAVGTENAKWADLLRQHAPFHRADVEKVHELTDNYVEIEKMCFEDPSGSVSTHKRTCNWAIRLQLMEDTFFAVQLGRYPNAPDNRGWMNLFRAWTRSDEFDDAFKKLRANYTPSFVEFCEAYIIGWGPIDQMPVPHPWDDEPLTPLGPDGRKVKVKGVFLDAGIAATSE